MDSLALLFPAALAALGLVALVGIRHPVLARMALRNGGRRPRQTFLIVLGLLVGTALITASLVSGDSLEYSIVEASYDAFWEVDESVYLEGYNFFPQFVETDLGRDPDLGRVTDAIGSNILWDAATTNERTGQYEPSVRLVGFDPKADLAFGAFRNGDERFTGESLGPRDAVIHEELAAKLRAQVGDDLVLNFSAPVDPLLPRIEFQGGAVNATATGLPVLGSSVSDPWEGRFRVNGTVVSAFVGLFWNESATSRLNLAVDGPEARHGDNATRAPLRDPRLPQFNSQTWVNFTGDLAKPLPTGSWNMVVSGEVAVQVPFAVSIIQLEPFYNASRQQVRLEELLEQFPDFDPSSLESQIVRVTQTVRVAWIYDTGKGPNFKLPNRLTVFVRLHELQSWLGREGEVNWVKISNIGGVEEGAERTPEVYPQPLNDALERVKALHAEHPAVRELRTNNDKVFWLDQARRVGELFTVFLTSVVSFSVLAGLLLVINIFTMLAEERKAELGISRAVGLQRRHLTRLFTLEGAYYALPAAAVGTFAGLGLALALIAGFNAFGDPQTFPRIPFRLEPASLLQAFAVGLLLTLATVYVGARRASRLNIVRAIRNLEEPEHHPSRVRLPLALVLLGLGAVLTAVAYAGAILGEALPSARNSFTLQVVGPLVLALGAAVFLRLFARRRMAYTLVAAGLFAYYTLTLFLIREYNNLEANVWGPVRAVLMAICVVVIVVHNEWTVRLVGRLLRAVPPFVPVARVATSYPLQRKFRTALTLTMFSVILLIVSLFSIFGALFAPDPGKESGGYDIQATSTVPVESLDRAGASVLDRVEFIDMLPHFLVFGGTLVRVENTTTGQFGPPLDYVYGIDDAFAGRNGFRLLHRDPSYPDDAAAYRAVAQGDDRAIVAYPYSTDEFGNDGVHEVGDTVQISARGGVRDFRIVGIQEQFHFKGVFVGQETLRLMYSNRDSLFLIKLKEGQDPAATAQDLEAAYRDIGLDANWIREEVKEETEQFRQIFTLIQLFLSLGLIVGILSLGIVTARSVIERRQEIGMLRALGYRRRDIRRAFLLEMVLLVALGILIGAALALLVSYGLYVGAVKEQLNIPYVVPWVELLVISLVALVMTTLATLAPIVRASRIPPADALRYIE